MSAHSIITPILETEKAEDEARMKEDLRFSRLSDAEKQREIDALEAELSPKVVDTSPVVISQTTTRFMEHGVS